MKTANENIFESNSQLLFSLNAEDIRMLFDRILIRDQKDPGKVGSIWIPETAAERGVGKRGLLRIGVVVAVGPGDPWAREKMAKGSTQVMRKSLGECETCAGCGQIKTFRSSGGMGMVAPASWSKQDVPVETCPACKGDGIRRHPMYCKPGDTVIYDRRKEGEIFINGERFGILHEEQAVLAILDSAAPEGA